LPHHCRSAGRTERIGARRTAATFFFIVLIEVFIILDQFVLVIIFVVIATRVLHGISLHSSDGLWRGTLADESCKTAPLIIV
jgi:hypothetical protein